MKLNLVEGNEQLVNKGDAIIVMKGKLKQLIIVCPGCGKATASRGEHIYDENTQTYTPSIVHDKNYGGCGWHGWLTNGEFKQCQLKKLEIRKTAKTIRKSICKGKR